MGNIAYALEDAAGARGYHEAAYALCQEFDDPEGTAVALNHLGQVAHLWQLALLTAMLWFAGGASLALISILVGHIAEPHERDKLLR